MPPSHCADDDLLFAANLLGAKWPGCCGSQGLSDTAVREQAGCAVGETQPGRFPLPRSTAKMRAMKNELRQRFIDPAPIVAAAFGPAQDGGLGDVRAFRYACVS